MRLTTARLLSVCVLAFSACGNSTADGTNNGNVDGRDAQTDTSSGTTDGPTETGISVEAR